MKRTKAAFAGLFVVMLTAIWGGVALEVSSSRAERLKTARIAAGYQAQTLAATASTTIKRIDALLLELRSTWRLERNNFAKTVQQRQADIFDIGFQVAVIDATGYLAFSSLQTGPERIFLGEREHFKVHAEGKRDELFISRPLKGKVSGKWSIQFTRRIEDDGHFAGVLVLSVSPDAFVEINQHLDLGPRDVVTIVRSSGEIMARQPDADPYLGVHLSNVPFLEENSPVLGTYQRHSQSDGVERLTGYFKIPSYGMTFLVGRAVDDLLAPEAQVVNTAVAIGGLLTVLASTLLLSLYRWSALRHAANAAQAKLAGIVGASGDAIIAYGPDGTVDTWNAGAERLFGFSAEDCLGKSRDLLIPEDLLEQESETLRLVQEGHTVSQRETFRLNNNGSRLTVSITSFPISGGSHLVGGMAEIIRDISEQKRTEANLTEAVEKLTVMNAEMERYAIIAAHDLREPTRAIASYARILELQAAAKLSADERDALRHLTGGAKRLHEMIGGLLDFARIPNIAALNQSVDAAEACRAAVDNLETVIQESAATIEIGTLPTLETDLLLMIQLFQNLIANAIKFRSAERELLIRVHAHQQDGEWRFAVEDNGSGFDARNQDVFELFRQLGPRDARDGVGTGLAVCRRIVQRLGGRIWAESEPGKGSVFHFSLPG